MSKEYHGNLLDTSFSDPQYLDKFEVFAKKKKAKQILGHFMEL